MKTVLIDKDDYNNQYKLKNVNISGECKTKLEKHMLESQKWTPEQLEKLFTMAGHGLTKFYNPQCNIEKVVKVLCLGKVQSGKTAFFITTMAMAMDNGYQLFYVIGGTKNNLLSQNRNRIQREFKNNDDVFIMDINGADVEEVRHKLRRGYKVILMILKHKNISSSSNLTELENIASELNAWPSVIVDDEGDEYSQAKETGDNPNSKKKVRDKAVHSSLRKCIENMKRGVYLSVTATPQSNLLVSTLNTLSPDECILVEPGDGYTGASTFHDTIDSQFVEEANDHDRFEETVPESFREALRYFILGCAIRKFRGDDGAHSMLVHPSKSVDVHKGVADKISALLSSITKQIQNPNNIAHDTIKAEFKKTFEKYKREFIGETCFESVWNFIERNLDRTKIFIINGRELDDLKKREDLKQQEMNYKYKIYIGGAMLERGITLENLAVTYIYRQSQTQDNVDTLFQRARWFGYKEEYIDLCKVYMPDGMAQKFINLNDHEVYLWKTIEKFLETGQPMQKMERIFVLNYEKLRLTRTSITKTISTKSKCLGYIYDKAIDFKEENRKHNLTLYESFVKKYENEFISYKEGNHRNDYVTLKFSDFYKDFLQKYKFPASSKRLNYETLEDIYELIENEEMSDSCTVINMKVGEDIQRKLTEGRNFIKELPQGYNKTSKSIYLGDKKVGENSLSVQLHYFYTDDINKKYLLLALNNPYDEVAINYVTGDNYYESEQ